MIFVHLLCGLLTLGSSLAEEVEQKPKPFGFGHGPVYIGGSDTRYDGLSEVHKINGYFKNYRKLSGKEAVADRRYEAKWGGKNLCEEGCPSSAECQRGFCVCKNETLQIFGQCVMSEFAWAARGDEAKYRKPPDPARPDYCFETENANRNVVRREHASDPKCQLPPFIKHFDPYEQNCTSHGRTCNERGVNLICDRNIDRCKCRHGTVWNTKTMECQVFIDVNCFDIENDNNTENKDIVNALKSKNPSQPGQGYTEEELRMNMCFILDEESEEYLKNQVDETDFYIFGLSVGAFFATCCGSICAACCCCKCCERVREKIRQLDPRYRFKQMDQNTQMAALAAVAAGELADKMEQREDEARAAQIQGGYAAVPNPGYPPPGGYPVPGGYPAPGGYLPSGGYPPPQGYSAPGYGYPQGYAPIPQYQPGYIPQASTTTGLLNVAPEGVLAGAGMYTGNNTMTAMGVLGVVDKVNMTDEKEERLKAAVMKGAPPPPPMGYAGGATLPESEKPPPANYPRQT